MRKIFPIDRIDQLARLVNQATHQRLVRLLLIPRTSPWPPQAGDCFSKFNQSAHSPDNNPPASQREPILAPLFSIPLLPPASHPHTVWIPLNSSAAEAGYARSTLVSVLIGINDTRRRLDRDDPTTTAAFRLGYTRLLTRLRAAAIRAPAAHWLPDGVHPSPGGHALIADVWLQTLDA